MFHRAKATSAIPRLIRIERGATSGMIRNSRSNRDCAGPWLGTGARTQAHRWIMLSVIRDTIRKIPKGKVATYGDVARAAGFPGSARQVVWALHKSRGLPWHRVLGAGGKVLLPGESGLEQRLRLETEGVAFRSGRVWMEKHQYKFRSLKPARVRK